MTPQEAGASHSIDPRVLEAVRLGHLRRRRAREPDLRQDRRFQRVWQFAGYLGVLLLGEGASRVPRSSGSSSPPSTVLRLGEQLGRSSTTAWIPGGLDPRLVTRSPWGTGCVGTGFVVWFPKDEPDYGDQEPWFALLHEAMHAYYGFWGLWETERAATLCQRIAVNAMFGPVSGEARHAQESDAANEIQVADLRYYAQREPEMVQHLKQKLRELGYDPDLTPWRA